MLPFVVMLIPRGQGVGPAKPQRNHGTHMDSSDVVGEGFALLRAWAKNPSKSVEKVHRMNESMGLFPEFIINIYQLL